MDSRAAKRQRVGDHAFVPSACHHSGGPAVFSIFVNCGRTITILAHAGMPITKVKNILATRLGIACARIRLSTLGGRPLHGQRENSTLADCQIGSGSSLRLMISDG